MANLKYIGKNILNHTLEIKKGDVSGSSSSTGSFGRGEVTTLEASSFGSSATMIKGSLDLFVIINFCLIANICLVRIRRKTRLNNFRYFNMRYLT